MNLTGAGALRRNGAGVLACLLFLLSVLTCRAATPLALRGTATSYPFWLGTNLYTNAWVPFGRQERSTDWWWYDKDHWKKTFESYRSGHLSAMVFWHPHPYVGLVNPGKFPEATYFSPQEIEKQAEMFRWITSEGRKYGVKIYFLTWNICLPPGFCRAHNLPEFGADTPLVQEYTRYMVAELFRTYPDLGGLITMAAENPPGCVDFVEKAIVPGLIDSTGPQSPRKELPTLVFWTWCSYPEDAKRILEAYPGPKYALHYLQYEQFTKPMADPRILMTSRALGDVPVVAMGGPSTATSWMYWGDPFFVQKSLRDLARKNGGGIIFSGTDSFSFIAERWVAREAFERYSFDPFLKDGKGYWEGRITQRYGDPAISRPLFRAMLDSSNIMSRFMCLVHSQSDVFRPQCGLPLVNFLEMPTISSYVFENHEYVGKDGRLHPNMGLTWPNPDWGEKVLSIKEYIRALKTDGRGAFTGSTTPVEIADEMERLSRSTLVQVDAVSKRMGQVTTGKKELENTLKLMRINAFFGLHACEKVRAGIDWESWRTDVKGSHVKDVLTHLDSSISWWMRYCDAARGVWPRPLEWTQSRVPCDPPWSHLDIWNGYARATFNPEDMTPLFLREKELVAAELNAPREKARLPLFPELDVPAGDVKECAMFDFEEGLPAGWQVGTDPGLEVRTTRRGEKAVEGRGSLLIDTRKASDGWHICLFSKHDHLKLTSGEKYALEFDYTIISSGPREGTDGSDPRLGTRTPFAVAARTDAGGVAKDIGSNRFWGGAPGRSGRRIVTLEPVEFSDYHIFFAVKGRCVVLLDNIKLSVYPKDR